MLAKRIIPCLDVADGKVVKGVQFKNHKIIGDVLELASFYARSFADELVFYDIKASSRGSYLDPSLIKDIACCLNIPFTVAGGIDSLIKAKDVLKAGADKISINSPALANPYLINELSQEFGNQCLVIGIDSLWVDDNYYVYQYTGDENKAKNTWLKTCDWILDVQERGAGEIVLNCMQADGSREGYDLPQLKLMRPLCKVPLIASGGAGKASHFVDLFKEISIEAALAASIFHEKTTSIDEVKQTLKKQNIEVRL